MSTLPSNPATDFVIRPSHYRARLDVHGGVIDGRQRVLCGALNEDGRYTCGHELAYVHDLGKRRELVFWPGWIYRDGKWQPTENQKWRDAHGLRPAYRRSKVTRSEGPAKGRKFQPGTFVHRFPAVAICYDGHINILEADRLDVITEEEYFREMIAGTPIDERLRLLPTLLRGVPEEWQQRWRAEGLIP